MPTIETIANLSKKRGFIFPSSEIYGGFASTWDYGPLGVELKNNVKRAWWKAVVQERDDMVGLDGAILMHPQVWVASGHVERFVDDMVACKYCRKTFRADHVWPLVFESEWALSLLELYLKHERLGKAVTGVDLGRWAQSKGKQLAPNLAVVREPAITLSWLAELSESSNGPIGLDERTFLTYMATEQRARGPLITPCPFCGGDLCEARAFNLLFKTTVGPVEDSGAIAYFRPETAQAIFVNFDNVLTTSRKKLPFGIAQIGKAFRNEITPGHFTFRTREFEQMEIEYFVRPGTDEEWHQRWIDERQQWFANLGLKRENLRLYEHPKEKLSHYSKRTVDLLYRFFPERGEEEKQFEELEGIANRTDYDLSQHAAATGKDLTWFDPETNEHVKPYVIEPSVGVDRSVLAFLLDAYAEELVRDKKRTVLRLHRDLAPIKVAVLPLLKNRPELVELAHKLAADLRKRFVTVYDDTAGIGRLYRRQDEIGTLYCVTVDVQSADSGDEKYDGCVTVRERDSMEQTRVNAEGLVAFLRERLED